MVLKTISAMGMFLLPFVAIILFGNAFSPVVVWFLWLIMGVGKAFVGTAVMHDSLHGSYSSKRSINNAIGFCSYLLGANPKMWQIQHNVIHHSFTNVHQLDEDIEPHYVLRFSPDQPHRWFHRYQHIYAWFFYCTHVLLWSSFKDFKKLVQYRNRGYLRSRSQFYKYLLIITVQKLIYFAVLIGLPMYVLEWSFLYTLAMYVVMEAVTGLLLSFVFQTAHVVPENQFFTQDKSDSLQNWAEHQLMTTSNYGRKSKVLCWFTGGLNFQIEHHLFPNICHIHYPKIAKIVKETANEYGLPYFEFRTFHQAIFAHYNQLKMLGNVG